MSNWIKKHYLLDSNVIIVRNTKVRRRNNLLSKKYQKYLILIFNIWTLCLHLNDVIYMKTMGSVNGHWDREVVFVCNLLHIHAMHEYTNVMNLEFTIWSHGYRKKGNEFISIHKEWWAVNDFIFTTLIIYFLWRVLFIQTHSHLFSFAVSTIGLSA